MALTILLSCAAVLLGTSAFAVAGARRSATTFFVYLVTLAVSASALGVAATALVSSPASAQTMQLPIGLPWLGAHFRLDALAAFFLVVVNLGGITASLYGLGYGAHEACAAAACCRSSRRFWPA